MDYDVLEAPKTDEAMPREKIMNHRREVMLREAGNDSFLKEILANGQRKAVEGIVDELVRDEANSTGQLFRPEMVVKQIKDRWTERQADEHLDRVVKGIQ